MKKIILLFVLVLSFTVQAEIAADLTRCTQITNNEDRLDCFDTVAAYYQQNGTTQTKVKPIENKTQNSDVIVLSREDTFGKSAAEMTSIDKIKSTINGDFNGWKKGSIITLANGQKWKVTSNSKGYTKMTNPKVEIERGFWGSYNMKVEGLNSKAKVKRVD